MPATFGHLRAAREAAERDILLLCAHFADLHNVDSRAGDVVPRRGAERPVHLGGEGTPLVWEFAVAEVAAELGATTWSTRRLMADALDVRRRLRRLWRGLDTGTVLAGLARKVAQATRELTADQAAMVDERTVAYADGRLPFSRFMSRLEGLVVAADPAAAAARERKGREEEFAKVGQSNDHGQKTLYVRTGAAQMARIDATIAFYAEALASLGDTDPLDTRRSKAVLLLANPTQAVAFLQALDARRRGQADGAGSAPPDAPVDLSGNDDGAVPPPPPPGWDDELDLALPADGDSAESGGGGGTHTSEPQDTPVTDSTGPPDSPAAFLGRFFTRFRPTVVSPCACQGGGFLLDAASMLPRVTLYLHGHIESLGNGDGVVRWEGLGPITGEYLRTVLGPHARCTVKPVLDLEGTPPADAYEVPTAVAEALHLRTPFDVFPFGVSTARGKQKDHTVPYDFGEVAHDGRPESRDGRRRIRGQTGLHNLGGMTTFHHRVKTHGRWQVRQPFPGVYLWRSPRGSMFYVDNSGTRQLSDPVVRRRSPASGGQGREVPASCAQRSAARESESGPAERSTDAAGLVFRTAVGSVLHDETPAIARFRRVLEAA